ncbi:hypothetical protein HQ590_05595 [bacterium]|nr:hypothetical protein [bacterium]
METSPDSFVAWFSGIITTVPTSYCRHSGSTESAAVCSRKLIVSMTTSNAPVGTA